MVKLYSENDPKYWWRLYRYGQFAGCGGLRFTRIEVAAMMWSSSPLRSRMAWGRTKRDQRL